MSEDNHLVFDDSARGRTVLGLSEWERFIREHSFREELFNILVNENDDEEVLPGSQIYLGVKFISEYDNESHERK